MEENDTALILKFNVWNIHIFQDSIQKRRHLVSVIIISFRSISLIHLSSLFKRFKSATLKDMDVS